MIEIAPITENDLNALSGLYEQLSGKPNNSEAMKATFRSIHADSDYYLLGAKSADGALVGTVMAIVCMDPVQECRPFMVMENLVVDKSCHRRGVGALLVEAVESLARKRNCMFVEFCSSSFRSGAHAFYEAAGYDPDMVRGFRKFF